jgi:Family of unknown function (DUF6444)
VAEVAQLTAEVAAIKEKLGQNSLNSSLPPSLDSPIDQPTIRRKSAGRKRGAQARHRGVGHILQPIEEVDRFAVFADASFFDHTKEIHARVRPPRPPSFGAFLQLA